MMNKALTVRGAQQLGHRYIPSILKHIAAGDLSTEHLATHVMPLDEGPRAYQMFKDKQDGCVRAVFQLAP
jgi:threonine dehydrogenase-like Zn-dependent dehydrogenase